MPSTNNIMGKCILFCESPITCISSDIVQEVSSLVKSFKIFFRVVCVALILFEIILAASANTL